ncbi:MAG: hypothetical protein ABW321_34280 [Polyangiales bacterium]
MSAFAHTDIRRRALSCLVPLYLATVGLITLAVTRVNAGVFVYTLDDAYIHLALARWIRVGHYGINAHELASPSSSVLWPFLLAPFAASPYGEYAPLLINSVLGLLTLWVIADLVTAVVSHTPLARPALLSAGLTILLVLTSNTLGLVFLGMEHSLQLLCACLVARGLVRFGASGRYDLATWAAVIVAPLVRYESLGLSGAFVVFLVLQGRRRAAALTACGFMLPLAGFSLWLLHIGQKALPASILVKSRSADEGLLAGAWSQLIDGLTMEVRGPLVAACGLGFLATATLARDGLLRRIAAVSCLAVGLHLLVGRYGWFNRYEAYLWGYAWLLCVALGWPAVARRIDAGEWPPWRVATLTGLVFVTLGAVYIRGVWLTPEASNNIYGQQYQMRRFARAWAAPIAVNDLGLVAYGSDQYVLDLWGLASLDALAARKQFERDDDITRPPEQDGPSWLARWTDERGVELVMIYDAWFGRAIPRGWKPLGDLYYLGNQITAAEAKVSFYATTEAAHARATELLRGWQAGLPESAGFVFASGPDPHDPHDPHSHHDAHARAQDPPR